MKKAPTPQTFQMHLRHFQLKSETVVWRCSVEKVFLEISQISQKALVPASLVLIQLQASGMFYCEFCEIIKNIFITEHLRWLLL